jgi:hypothetical protein
LFVVTKDKNIKSAVKSLKKILLNSCNVKSIKIVQKEPKGDFIESEFEQNKVLLDLTEDKEMYEDRLCRELTRKIQDLRKQYKFVVTDRIKLSLKSDQPIEEILKKFVEEIKKEVGAETVEIGVLKGKNEGELVFQEKKVQIKFE